MLAFNLVTCFHFPMGPSQTSCGVEAEWRTTAVNRFLPAIAAHESPEGHAPCSLVQMVCGAPPLILTLPKPALPSTFSAKVTSSGLFHDNAEGEALKPGVRFRASPPVIDKTCTSPPVDPSSLINPSMNATCFPSGETRGSAICNLG